MVVSFLKWMEAENIINLNDIMGDQTEFNTRFCVQKYVFIAQHMGLNTDYEYKHYLHGPYSAKLNQDYYDFARGQLNSDDQNLDFDKKVACRDIIKNRDKKWLEVATTLILVAKRGETDVDKLIDRVANIKFLCTTKYIRSVLDDVLKTPLAAVFSRVT